MLGEKAKQQRQWYETVKKHGQGADLEGEEEEEEYTGCTVEEIVDDEPATEAPEAAQAEPAKAPV